MENSNVKILIGSHGLNKSEWMYNYLIRKSRDEKDPKKINLKEKLYLVVPEQDTNEKQRIMMNRAKEADYGTGIINIDVVSFDRIAHNVFDILNIEPKEEKIIDDDAKTMLLVFILSELNKDGRLKYYSKMSNKVGFAKKLTKAMSEFYSYDVTDEDFAKAIAKCDDQATLKIKLEDFNLIFNEFKNKLSSNGYSIKEDKYDKLNKVITTKDDIFNGAVVAFEGFTGFTPVQLDIFKKIADVAKEVYVLIDERFDDESNINLNEVFNENNVFYLSNKFVRDIGRVLNIKDLDTMLCDCGGEKLSYKYDDKEDLSFLEKNIYNYKSKNSLNIEPENIEVYEAKNVEEEVLNIAHIVKRLVKENSELKYNDIRIVVPRVEDYSDKMIRVFNKYKIPLFVDDSKTLLNSPYVETIRAAIDVIAYDFSYDSVMRYINSGIIGKNKNIYDLDNFIREYGIRGYKRYAYVEGKEGRKDPGFDTIINYHNENSKKKAEENNNTDFKVEDTKYSKILETKREIFDPLCNLYNSLKEKSVKKYIDAIENFVKEIKLDAKFNSFLFNLAYHNDDLNRANDIAVLTTSKEITIETIKNIKSINGLMKDEIEISDFKRLFDVGFIDKGVKVIPHSLDQVVIGDFMRSRFYNPKVEICLGMNQSVIPAETNDASLIDDKMREIFKDIKELSQTTVETALNQRLYIYLALTNPTDKLILSYPRLNTSNESDSKSSVISAIEKLFGENVVDENGDNKFSTKLSTINANRNNIGFYQWNDVVEYIALNMQEIRKDYGNDKKTANRSDVTQLEIDKLATKKAIMTLNALDEDKFKHDFENLLHRKNYVSSEQLKTKLAEELFTLSRGESKGSASSIETFNKCPYRYFLERTIKLKERKNYEISSMDLGNLIHSVLEIIFSKYDSKALFAKQNFEEIIDEAIKESLTNSLSFKELKNENDIYFGNNKLELVKNMTKNLIVKSLKYIKKITANTKFNENYEEVPFNFDVKSKDDKEESSEEIEGRIDKVEIYKDGENAYVNVIDYKSGMSAKTISSEDVENGVSIQLILYLDFMKNYNDVNLNKSSEERLDMKGVKNIIPCGAFYLWIDDPIIRIESKSEINTISNEKIKKLSYVGIVNCDESAFKSINESLTLQRYKTGANEGKVRALIDESNGFELKGIKIENTKELDDLTTKVHKKINESIREIKSGVIKAKPNDVNNCKYCPYVNVCKQDITIDDENVQKS